MTESSLSIRSGRISASLSGDTPQILAVNAIDGGGVAQPRVHDLSNRSYHDASLDPSYDVTCGPNFVSYIGNVSLDGRDAGQFALRFLAQDDRLTVTCEFREEHEGFELMSVTVPLISVTAKRSGGMTIPIHGGRLVNIEESAPHEYVQRGACADMPLVALLKQGADAALLELTSLDDNILSAVSEDAGEKRGSLAVRFTHRYGAQNPDLPTFRVTNRTEALLTLFESRGKHWWVDGAKMLRRKVDTSIPPLYDGAVIYKLKLDQPDFDETQFMTFDDAVDRVRRLHNYTAGAPQIAYLNGWQFEGHDTGFPDVFTVNERVGGLAKFREAIETGPKYNAVLSFHDNYDDAYTDSPSWEDEIIALDEQGVPKEGGFWGGGQAYVIAPHKYIDRARSRIKRTVEMYGLSKTIHVDVFSVVPDRYDFDPANPAGFARSCEAKNYIVRAFREMGLDMTSEGICPAFVGNINYGWHFNDSDEPVYSAEQVIPLVPFIYHGRTIGAGGVENDRHLLKHLLWGLPFCFDIRKSTDLGVFVENYYLLYVPFFQLAHRTMQSYESENGWSAVRYDESTYVRVNYDENSYKVVVDGTTVAKDFTVACPMPQGGWIIYARDARDVTMPLPKGVDDVEVSVLSEAAPVPVHEYLLSEGSITVQALSRTPYHITQLLDHGPRLV